MTLDVSKMINDALSLVVVCLFLPWYGSSRDYKGTPHRKGRGYIISPLRYWVTTLGWMVLILLRMLRSPNKAVSCVHPKTIIKESVMLSSKSRSYRTLWISLACSFLLISYFLGPQG